MAAGRDSRAFPCRATSVAGRGNPPAAASESAATSGSSSGVAPAVPQERMSKLVRHHVMGKGAGANSQRPLAGNESTPLSRLRTRDQERGAAPTSGVVDPDHESGILHELRLHAFPQGGEHAPDAFPHQRIANHGGNEVVHRVHLIPSFFRRSRRHNPPHSAS